MDIDQVYLVGCFTLSFMFQMRRGLVPRERKRCNILASSLAMEAGLDLEAVEEEGQETSSASVSGELLLFLERQLFSCIYILWKSLNFATTKLPIHYRYIYPVAVVET